MLLNLLLALGLLVLAIFVGEWLVRRNRSGARLWGDFSQMLGGFFYFGIFALALLFEGVRWIALPLATGFWWVARTKSKDIKEGNWRSRVNG